MAACTLEPFGYIKTRNWKCFDRVSDFCHLKNILHCSDISVDNSGKYTYRIHFYSASAAAEVACFLNEKCLNATFVNS